MLTLAAGPQPLTPSQGPEQEGNPRLRAHPALPPWTSGTQILSKESAAFWKTLPQPLLPLIHASDAPDPPCKPGLEDLKVSNGWPSHRLAMDWAGPFTSRIRVSATLSVMKKGGQR